MGQFLASSFSENRSKSKDDFADRVLSFFSKVLTGGRTASFRRHWISGEDQDIVLCSNRPVGKTTEKGRRGLGAPVRGKQNLLSNSKQTPVCFSWPLVAAQESTTLN